MDLNMCCCVLAGCWWTCARMEALRVPSLHYSLCLTQLLIERWEDRGAPARHDDGKYVMKTLSVSVLHRQPSDSWWLFVLHSDSWWLFTQRFMMIVYHLIAYEHFENVLIHKDTLMKCRAFHRTCVFYVCSMCVLCAFYVCSMCDRHGCGQRRACNVCGTRCASSVWYFPVHSTLRYAIYRSVQSWP